MNVRSFAKCALVVGLSVACAHPRPEPRAPVASGQVASVTSGAVATTGTTAATIQTSFAGEGEIEARGEKTGRTRLALERLTVTAETSGDVAETSVEHVFRNDADEVLEGTLRFPLPEGAILTGVAMEIGGELMEGELVEREKARRVYEQIVDQMQDPALLEWDSGQTFKLRVFPIEAKRTKRVVIRFVAPIHRTSDGVFFAFRPPSSEAALTTERVAVRVDGRRVAIGEAARAASGEVLVKVASGPAPDVVTETTKDGTYWFARVRPAFASQPRPAQDAPRSPQALILLCDRSRSMLEARALERQTASMLLDELDDADRFAVIVGDVRARSLVPLAVPAADAKTKALELAFAGEPDGASDVGAMLRAAASAVKEARDRGLEPVVVYLGDGVATWGETRASELERLAKEAVGDATLHVVVLGKSTDDEAARALAAGGRGRLLRPKTERDAERAAKSIVTARTSRRLVGVHVAGAGGLEVASTIPATLYEDDELEVVMRAKRGATAPREVRLVGTYEGEPTAQAISLASARPAKHVERRWAKAKIASLEREGEAHKDEIVATSLEHGVMSRYTSFLVLESEQAYERFHIARKARQPGSADRRPDSRDLDGDTRTALVTPDHLQPGDPEVRVPAPADAQSVVVVFPFGETKTASLEADGWWVARFLVDRRTPDGSYEILVRITHADGRVEILKLPYVVDTLGPRFDVTVTPRRGGFEIRAKQRLTREEIEAQAPSSEGSLEDRRRRFAHVLTDAKRVEVRTPDGQNLSLVHVRLGEFVGTWTPSGTWAGAKLRLVAVDRALNETIFEAEVPR